MKVIRGVLWLLFLVIAAIFIWFKWSPSADFYDVRGRVVGFTNQPDEVIIEHEEIRGYMPAMTMTFEAKESNVIEELDLNEAIGFKYYVKSDGAYIDEITHLPDTALNPAGFIAESPDLKLPSKSDRVLVQGDTVDNVTLINQFEDSFQLHDFDTDYVLITFIYTRCPIPNFCPLMSKNFSEVHSVLEDKVNATVQMISISFDTKYDTPEVLREYGEQYVERFDDWWFASGSPEEIGTIAGQLGVVTQTAEDQIIHNLRTVLLSPDGRILKIWSGNDWMSEDVLKRLRR